MECARRGVKAADLDAQFKQRGIEKIILVGFVSNTCIESTARFGMELGYHVTLVKDATAAFEQEGMHAAHKVNGPRFAHAIPNARGFREGAQRGEEIGGSSPKDHRHDSNAGVVQLTGWLQRVC